MLAKPVPSAFNPDQRSGIGAGVGYCLGTTRGKRTSVLWGTSHAWPPRKTQD